MSAEEIATQTALFNELRLNESTPPDVLKEAKEKLGELKKAAALSKQGGKDATAAAGKKKERILLKTAKVRFLLYVCSRHLVSTIAPRAHAIILLRKCSSANI